MRASISACIRSHSAVAVRPDDHGAAHRAVVGQLGLGDHVLVPAGEVVRLRGENGCLGHGAMVRRTRPTVNRPESGRTCARDSVTGAAGIAHTPWTRATDAEFSGIRGKCERTVTGATESGTRHGNSRRIGALSMTPTLVRQHLPHAGAARPRGPCARARDWAEIQERMLVPLYEAVYERLEVGRRHPAARPRLRLRARPADGGRRAARRSPASTLPPSGWPWRGSGCCPRRGARARAPRPGWSTARPRDAAAPDGARVQPGDRVRADRLPRRATPRGSARLLAAAAPLAERGSARGAGRAGVRRSAAPRRPCCGWPRSWRIRCAARAAGGPRCGTTWRTSPSGRAAGRTARGGWPAPSGTRTWTARCAGCCRRGCSTRRSARPTRRRSTRSWRRRCIRISGGTGRCGCRTSSAT